MSVKNLAIIQVRTDSSRLPNKALLPISGIPIIGYMLKRLKYSKLINKIIIATTNQSSDDKLCKYISSLDIDIFRGSKEDVLNRFYNAALEYDPLTIIRLTGDCPLIDPYLVDELINFYYKNKSDYSWIHETYAEGLDAEIFSFKTLSICNEKAKYLSEREHITQYIHNNQEKFKRTPLINVNDDKDIRIVVDEESDYELVSIIANHFNKSENRMNYSFDDIKRYLYNNQKLLNINCNIERNEGLKISLSKDRIFKSKDKK